MCAVLESSELVGTIADRLGRSSKAALCQACKTTRAAVWSGIRSLVLKHPGEWPPSLTVLSSITHLKLHEQLDPRKCWSGRQLCFLINMHSLRELSTLGCVFDGKASMKQWALHLPSRSLQVLRLSAGLPPFDSLDWLSPMQSLTSLGLLRVEQPASLDPVWRLPKLLNLRLWLSGTFSFEMCSGAALTALRLTADGLEAVQQTGLAQLSGLRDLQNLQLSFKSDEVYQVNLQFLTALNHLTGLSRLSIAVDGELWVNFIPLAGLSQLKQLDIGRLPDWIDYRHLTTLASTLTYLTISAVGHGCWRHVAVLSSLQTLSMNCEGGLPNLEQLGGLTSLTLRALSISDLSPLLSIGALKTLRVDAGLDAEADDLLQQSQEILQVIGRLTTLTTLDLHHLPVVHLAALNELVQLQFLELGNIRDVRFHGCTLDWTRLQEVIFSSVSMVVDRENNVALHALQRSGILYSSMF